MKKLDFFFGLILIFLIIIFKFPALNLPYYWDGLIYTSATIDYLYHNPITIFLWEYSVGHPPFFFLFVAILFKIFGPSQILAHSTVLFFSFLTLYFTYLIGKNLFNSKVGIISSLILFFTPIFFSYSSLLFLAIPLAAFTMISLYFAIKSKPYWYFLFCSLAIVTETTGVLIAPGVFLAKILKQRKINKGNLIYFLPLITFFLLILINKIHYGQFLSPEGNSLVNINIIKNIFNLLMILKILLFDQYRWILTSIFLLSFINLKNIKKIDKKRLLLNFILSFIFFIFLFNLDMFTNLFVSNYQNISNYFKVIKSFSLLFSFFLFVILSSYKQIISLIKYKNNLLLILVALILVLAHSIIIPISPRYILFILPIIFIFFGYGIVKLFDKYSYLVLVILIIIFSLNFTGDRGSSGFTLETNMEYVDFIKMHQLAASYIEENFPNATVLTSYPQSIELQYPYGGYVKKPIRVVTIPPYPGITEYRKNFTQFLHPETIPKLDINLSEIDLYYYSPQEAMIKPIYDIKDKLNLTLIKRFELNNKSVEIYLVNK